MTGQTQVCKTRRNSFNKSSVVEEEGWNPIFRIILTNILFIVRLVSISLDEIPEVFREKVLREKETWIRSSRTAIVECDSDHSDENLYPSWNWLFLISRKVGVKDRTNRTATQSGNKRERERERNRDGDWETERKEERENILKFPFLNRPWSGYMIDTFQTVLAKIIIIIITIITVSSSSKVSSCYGVSF